MMTWVLGGLAACVVLVGFGWLCQRVSALERIERTRAHEKFEQYRQGWQHRGRVMEENARRAVCGLVLAASFLVGSVPALAKDLTVVLNDEERGALVQLCEMAKYANRMGAERLCEYFANKFAAAERAAEIGNAAPKPEPK